MNRLEDCDLIKSLYIKPSWDSDNIMDKVEIYILANEAMYPLRS